MTPLFVHILSGFAFAIPMTHGKTIQTRLYGQDRSTTYAIIMPFRNEGQVVGLLGFGFDSHELIQKKGVSEKEFMALNFTNP